jgi:hypothetical protein
MIKYNVNDHIHIKLTDYGKELIIKDYGYTYFEHCVESNKTEQGYYRLQLWTVMSYFGKYLYNGGKLPFEPNIYIEVDNLMSEIINMMSDVDDQIKSLNPVKETSQNMEA